MIRSEKDQTGQTGQGAFLGSQPNFEHESNKDYKATDDEEEFESEKRKEPPASLGGDKADNPSKGNYPNKQTKENKADHSEYIESTPDTESNSDKEEES